MFYEKTIEEVGAFHSSDIEIKILYTPVDTAELYYNE